MTINVVKNRYRLCHDCVFGQILSADRYKLNDVVHVHYTCIYIFIYDVHTRLSHTFICMLLLETGVGERGSRWGKMWESWMWGSRGWFELGEFGRSGWQQRPPSNNWTKTIDITTSFFQSVTRKHIVRSIPKAKFIKKIKLVYRVPQL